MLEQTKPLTKEDLVNELGVSGTTIINGFIEEDYRSDLQGREGCIVYEQMRKSDAQVFATLLACELPIRSTRWFIEAGKNKEGETDDQAQEVADFIEYNLFEALENTFDDLLREVLTMLPFGYSIFEKVYGIDKEGQIVLKKLGSRKQSTLYKWQTEDGKPGIVQLVPGNTDDATEESMKTSNVSIPMEKLVLFSFRKEGKNYEGASILRSAYKHWYIKDKLYKFDAVRHERQSVGIPVIYLPKNASDTDKTEAQRIVRNVRSTEQTGIVMPGPKDDGWLFEFADTKGSSGTDLFESIKHHNREISKNVLAQFLELGDTASGSRALGESQGDLFLLSLGAIAKQIADTFNKWLIQEMVDLNYDIGEYSYPLLKFEKLGAVDYSVLVNNLVALTGGGLLQTDDELEDYIRESLGLPAKAIDETLDEDTAELDSLDEEATNAEAEMGVDTEMEEEDEEFNEFITELNELEESQEFAMDQAAKDKISAALKKYWETHGKKKDVPPTQDQKNNRDLSSANSSLAALKTEMSSQIASMKASVAEARNIKDPKQRKAAIKAIKENWKKTKADLKGFKDRVKAKQKGAKDAIKKRKEEVKSKQKALKAEMDQVKGTKTVTTKTYHEHECNSECDHGDEGVFTDSYFKELSSLIDSKFIIEAHTHEIQ